MCILDVNVLALVSLELAKCSAVLKLRKPRPFFATQNGGVVSEFPSTIRFTFGYLSDDVNFIRSIYPAFSLISNLLPSLGSIKQQK